MFYSYAEKQGNVLFDGWQMRQIAFDTMRRYLYYSTGPLKENQMLNWNMAEISGGSPRLTPSASTTTHTPSAQRTTSPHSSSQQGFPEFPSHSSYCENVRWRKKIKVDFVVQIGKEHEFYLDDVHLKENDLFQVEIQGETRHLQPGEAPAPWPLLCPSAGLDGLSERFQTQNDEYVADPFFLRELYESLRDQFTNMRLERERLQLQTGQVPNPRFAHIQTLQSPRGKGEPLFKGSRVSVVLRLRNEYEYRRFCYVVQSVLGYDKLNVRPYRGLPPFDPRNGIIFAQIPMCVWHTFKSLDKAVIYTFLRGDLVGRTLDGQPTLFLRGAYICITHDTVLVFRDTGNIPRWLKMQDVREFHYNIVSRRPFFAFVSDPGGIDIIFIPQPPVYGAMAIRNFNPRLEILRVCHVVREMCFSSLEIRRVIDIKESIAASVYLHIEQHEAETGVRFKFDPEPGSASALSCPMPKEQLANVWREVQMIYAARDHSIVSQSAIPIYNNNPNDSELTTEQIDALSRRLERLTRNDVVGIPYNEARRVQPRQRSPGGRHATPRNATNSNSNGLESNTQGPRDPRNFTASRASFSCSLSSSTSFESMNSKKLASSMLYRVPGARYITTEEMVNGTELPVGEILVDQHSILMSQTPMARGTLPSVLLPEINVDQLMSCSIDAMRGMPPQPPPPPTAHVHGGGLPTTANRSSASPANSASRRQTQHTSAHSLKKRNSGSKTSMPSKASESYSIET